MSKGVGSTVDLLALTVMVSIVLLTLFSGLQGFQSDERFGDEKARNILIVLRRTPSRNFENVEYDSAYSSGLNSSRNLGEMTFVEIIRDDFLLNPFWFYENQVFEEGNEELTRSLESSLKKSLDAFLGERFGYRFEARVDPFKVNENVSVFYDFEVSEDNGTGESFGNSFELLVRVPPEWFEIDTVNKTTSGESTEQFSREVGKFSDTDHSEGKIVPMVFSLELWYL